MKLYLRADCIRLEHTGIHVRIVTFEKPSTALKVLHWCADKDAETATLTLLARCKELKAPFEDVWNSREVIPSSFGDKLKWQRAGYHIF